MRRHTSAGAAVVVCGSLLAMSTACGSTGTTAAETVTVFAAASLKAPFEDFAERFEDDHPGVTVQLNLAGSSELAAQIVSGAPADVFASANEPTMDSVATEGLLGAEPVVFATNTLTIVVPAGNPGGIKFLADLADPARSVVLCAPQVPCGAASAEVQRLAGVTIIPVSEEGSVTDVLGKVSSGQADAGLVYVTDIAAAAGTIEGIGFDEASDAVNAYPIAPVTGTVLGAEFIDLVLGTDGRRILADAGFGPPAP